MAATQSIADTALGLTPAQVEVLRSQQQVIAQRAYQGAARPFSSSSSRATTSPNSQSLQGRVLLDPISLEGLYTHLGEVIRIIERRIDKIQDAIDRSVQASQNGARISEEIANAEMARMRRAIAEIDRLEDDIENMENVRTKVREVRLRVERFGLRLDDRRLLSEHGQATDNGPSGRNSRPEGYQPKTLFEALTGVEQEAEEAVQASPGKEVAVGPEPEVDLILFPADIAGISLARHEAGKKGIDIGKESAGTDALARSMIPGESLLTDARKAAIAQQSQKKARQHSVDSQAVPDIEVHPHYLPQHAPSPYPQVQGSYTCTSCNRVFSRPSSLRIHESSHTGAKPFPCRYPGCNKRFSVRSNRKRHERGCPGRPNKESGAGGHNGSEGGNSPGTKYGPSLCDEEVEGEEPSLYGDEAEEEKPVLKALMAAYYWKYPRTAHASGFKLSQCVPRDEIPFMDKLKLTLEEYLGSSILWWPFGSVSPRPKSQEQLVSWKCVCGAHFNICINYFNVGIIQQMMPNQTHNPGNTPILPTHHTQSSGGAPRASQRQSVPFGGRTGPPSNLQRSEQRSFNNASLETQNPSSLGNGSAPVKKYLHWCVSAQKTITKLIELETEKMSEKTLVPSLLAAYATVRGLYSWLTLTSCAGVKFVKFRKLAIKAEYVTHLKDELPCRKTNQEYQYQYCDDPTTPEEDFVKWLQAVIAVRLAYPNCPETLALCNALEYIPKKVNGRMKTLDGYGMQATSAYCFWKAVLALFIASIPSGIFMIRWLAGHRGDWQNALGLLAVTYSLLNILVLQHDRWSMETFR